jgi:formamidopyrimidine-DNA glycosylase
MPELPDMEVFRQYVDATSRHHKTKSVAVRNEKILGRVCARKLQRALTFRQRFEGRKGGVKAALMNQNLLAAIGNVYSYKIHFQARLHPETRVAHLDGSTLEELHKEIRRVLETAIEREADPHKLPGLLPAFSQARRREVPAGQR